MSLANKVAIVTGGNSGIGQSVVVELAKQGASVVIDYVSHPEAAQAMEKELSALGEKVTAVQADVSNLADLQRLVAAAVDKYGRLDVMVNNAATYKSFLDFNGDNTINTADNLQFRSRFNKLLSWRV